MFFSFFLKHPRLLYRVSQKYCSFRAKCEKRTQENMVIVIQRQIFMSLLTQITTLATNYNSIQYYGMDCNPRYIQLVVTQNSQSLTLSSNSISGNFVCQQFTFGILDINNQIKNYYRSVYKLINNNLNAPS